MTRKASNNPPWFQYFGVNQTLKSLHEYDESVIIDNKLLFFCFVWGGAICMGEFSVRQEEIFKFSLQNVNIDSNEIYHYNNVRHDEI